MANAPSKAAEALESISHDLSSLSASIRTLLNVARGLESDERQLLEAVVTRIEDLKTLANSAKK